MVSKRNARDITPSSTTSTISSTPVPNKPSYDAKAKNANKSPQDIALGIWQSYLDTTPQRTKLIDTFMAFLVLVGVLQFVYCVLVGNFVCFPVLMIMMKNLCSVERKLIGFVLAFQCVFERLRCYRWTVCSYGFIEDTDQCGE